MPGHNTLTDLEAAINFQIIPDPGDAGAIEPRTGVCGLVSAAAETRTIAAPNKGGLVMILYLQEDGGTVTVTISDTINGTGDNTIAFADEGDAVLLISLPTATAGEFQWSCWKQYGGPAISTV